MPKEFAEILQTIELHKNPDQSLLLPYLCAESIEERVNSNKSLAEAYYAVGNIKQAKVFIERTWLLSDFSEDLLQLFIKINREAGDLDAMREAYKRIGMKKAKKEGVSAALPFFIKSMYVYADHSKGDLYKFDFDVLNEIGRLAEPLRFSPALREWKVGMLKLRIAYLVFGATHTQSVIIKILHDIGQNHDKELFEFAYFVPENELTVLSSYKKFKQNIQHLKNTGGLVVMPKRVNTTEALLEISKQIFDYSPDILVTSALLADLKQFYIAALRPAPVIIGLTHGPPQQFSSTILDWSISWDYHAQMDCLSGCSIVPLEVTLPSKMVQTTERRSYGIPHDAVVLVAAGRPTKFLDRNYWQAFAAIMACSANAFLVVIGLTEKPAFFNDLFPGDFEKRVLILGWMPDYIDLLSISDIMIDTYPSGGGLTLLDAMALGLPVVSFKNNHMQLFNQTDWSPGEWIVGTSELCAERGNWSDFNRIVSQLITNKNHRMQMGELCKNIVISTRSSPPRMVSRIEQIYMDVLSRKMALKNHQRNIVTSTDRLPDTIAFRAVVNNEKPLQLMALGLIRSLARVPFFYKPIKILINYLKE